MAKGYMNSYEDLKTWFMMLGTPKWNLYRGHVESVGNNRSNLIYKQDSDEYNLEDSFEELRKMIEINSAAGGHFSIYVPAKSNNVGPTVFFVSPNTMPARGGAQVAGFPTGGLGYISKEELSGILEKERNTWELERRIEDLEAAQDSHTPILEKFLNGLLEDGTAGKVLVAGITKLMGGNPTQVALAGFGNQVQPDTSIGEEEEEISEDEIDFAVDLVSRFRPYFSSEQEMRVFLLTVANKFETNPAVAKQLFGA